MTTDILHFAAPFLRSRFGGSTTPVLAGYKITNRCNLRCAHCPYWSRVGRESSYETVVRTMERLRAMGVKILILEGGEPLLWRDGNKTIEDVANGAQRLFPSVCMTTNGTLPWDGLPLDRVWVSVDGPPRVHDAIRGAGAFERTIRNMERYLPRRAYVSTTVNQTNASSIREMLRILEELTAGVTIQFHYPYDGLPDPLFVPPEERAVILDELLTMKRAGLPVANSAASLTDMKRSPWTCNDGLLANAEPDGTIMHGCYLKNRGEADCRSCGFAAHNEMSLAFAGRLESIRTGMEIFFGGRKPFPAGAFQDVQK